MAGKRSFSPSYKFYIPEDPNKQAFVYWYEDGKRVRLYGDINQYDTPLRKERAAIKLIQELKLHSKPELYTTKKWENLVMEWIENQRFHWRKKSYQTYSNIASIFFKWMSKRKFNSKNVEAFFKYKSEHLHPTSYNAYRQKLMQMIIAVGGDESLFKNIKPVKATKTPARYFQKHQIQRLKNQILKENPDLWLFVQLYPSTTPHPPNR